MIFSTICLLYIVNICLHYVKVVTIAKQKKKPNIRYINEIYDQNHFLYFFSQMDFSNPHTYTHREANDEQRHMQICFRRYVTFE